MSLPIQRNQVISAATPPQHQRLDRRDFFKTALGTAGIAGFVGSGALMNNAGKVPPTEPIDIPKLKFGAGLAGACASIYLIGCSE